MTGVRVWSCTLACYTRTFITAGGAAIDGTYVYMEQLPFEDRDTNKNLDAFLTELGDKADSFGANSWQAGMAFKEAVDRVVKKEGVNGLTSAAFLAQLKDFGQFDANGWLGKKSLRGVSPCFMMMQIRGGKYVRVYPAKRGTLDCNPDNVVTVSLDPAANVSKWT